MVDTLRVCCISPLSFRTQSDEPRVLVDVDYTGNNCRKIFIRLQPKNKGQTYRQRNGGVCVVLQAETTSNFEEIGTRPIYDVCSSARGCARLLSINEKA